MTSDSLISALERYPRGQRATIAHVLRAAVLRTPCLSFGQLLTVWSVFAAPDLGGLTAIRNFAGFRRKNHQRVKAAVKSLCRHGFLQEEAQAIVVPLRGSPAGGPYQTSPNPVYTWQPQQSATILREESGPIVHETSFHEPVVETRFWRPAGFTDRFMFPEPAACPRMPHYAATADTIARVERENEGVPSAEILRRWTIEAPVRDHYLWEDVTAGQDTRYPFPTEFADFYMDLRVARSTHYYHAADMYVQLLRRAPDIASSYYRLDRVAGIQHRPHFVLPDGVLLTPEGKVGRLTMFGGSSFREITESRTGGDRHWSRTTLCQIHERIQQHSYEFY